MHIKQGFSVNHGFQLKGIKSYLIVTFIGVMVNIVAEVLAHYVGIKNYCASLATLITGIFFGAPIGISVGIISTLFETPRAYQNIGPYIATHLFIATFMSKMARKTIFWSIFTATIVGLLLGVISAFVNALLTAWIPISSYNTLIVTGFLFANKHCLILAIFLINLAFEPWIKAAECLMALWMFQYFPSNVKEYYFKSLTLGKVNDKRHQDSSPNDSLNVDRPYDCPKIRDNPAHC